LSDKLLGSKMLKSLARRIKVPIGDDKKSDAEVFCEIADINSEVSFELPAINYAKYNGKCYAYAYGTSLFKIPFTVVKLNVNTGLELQVNYDRDGSVFLPSEPVFVPDPDGVNEDDGVLLVMVLSDKNDFLSVLDARDLSEIARADVPPDVKAAFTFHGFFADSKIYPKFNSHS
jgi:carotenoid cleavage dioxygenase-like enzyme